MFSHNMQHRSHAHGCLLLAVTRCQPSNSEMTSIAAPFTCCIHTMPLHVCLKWLCNSSCRLQPTRPMGHIM
jgi:hypothetical protein